MASQRMAARCNAPFSCSPDCYFLLEMILTPSKCDAYCGAHTVWYGRNAIVLPCVMRCVDCEIAISDIYVFLASNEARYIKGAVIEASVV